MRKEKLFSMNSPFRDDFNIYGYRFGSGEKTIAIVGAMRGDEIEQQYISSQIVKHLKKLEDKGKIIEGHEILVVPSVNPFSMNISKRFWAMDNTDINRMFPGYNQGETTQRIAAALFEVLQGYKYGVQLVSFYLPNEFIPHVSITETGYEDLETASLFGLPYICLHKPLPVDTTLLNYNWQIWGTKSYSIFAGNNDEVGTPTCNRVIEAFFRFMNRTGVIKSSSFSQPDYNSVIIRREELVTVKSPKSGIITSVKSVNEEVAVGDVLAKIIDPYEGSTIAEIKSPVDGVLFSAYNRPLTLQNTPLFKIVEY